MDIDGTLVTGPEDTLEHITRQLRRLRVANIRFTVATGRTLAGARSVVKRLLSVRMQMPPMIAYNGAVVASPADSAVIRRVTIPKDTYHHLIAEALAQGLSPLVYTCGKRLDLSPVEKVYAQLGLANYPDAEFNGMEIQWVPDLDAINVEDVTSVLLCYAPRSSITPSALETLRSRFPKQLSITTSGGRYIEIADLSATKLSALQALATFRRVDLEEFMAIGDSFNDFEMIRSVGVGVAVANAPAEVKAVADYVCDLQAAQGVVEALRWLLSAVRVSKIQRRAAQ
jgi:Cof subfamily protein (haloacid dehalogenase superfamily)